jgi:dihydropyrimidinase
VKGWPVVTILRGQVIVENGKLAGGLGQGQLVARRIDPAMLRRPAA